MNASRTPYQWTEETYHYSHCSLTCSDQNCQWQVTFRRDGDDINSRQAQHEEDYAKEVEDFLHSECPWGDSCVNQGGGCHHWHRHADC